MEAKETYEVHVLACYILLLKKLYRISDSLLYSSNSNIVVRVIISVPYSSKSNNWRSLSVSCYTVLPKKSIILVFLTNFWGILAGVDSDTIGPATRFFFGQ
jgi:hypothetical protein